jgi:cytidylate kinase
MAIVIISSADEPTRRELAESLARKLDCPVMSREQVVERATEYGVPVGRLEVAVLKHSVPKERLARHKAQYLSVVTTSICDGAEAATNLVYHGRAGNLLLDGVSHVLRVRVVANEERRLTALENRLKLSREKALAYMTELDQDIENWVRFAHGVDMNDPHQYDLMLNLDQISLQSASATACTMAQLPEFQPTPASRRIMEDLCLAARARLQLGHDERTARADLSVSVTAGRVTVTYMPAQARVAEAVPEVLSDLKGARELVSTMAVSNLLWVAETFDRDTTAFSEITDLARRWGAAVELARLVPQSENGDDLPAVPVPVDSSSRRYVPKADDVTGGIEEDLHGGAQSDGDGGLGATSDALIDEGLFGGSRIVTGGADQIVTAVKAQNSYSLVVVGDVFVAKGEASRVRLKRELCASVHDQARVPVLGADELRRSFLFDRRQILRLIASLAGVIAVYALIFTQQRAILDFLGGTAWKAWRPAATLAVLATVPLVAYLYGSVSGLILSWLKFE